MKKSSIILGYDEERLSAARLYLKRRGLTLEEKMAAHLDRLYEKYVPQAVREYIESRGDVPPAIKKANRQQGKNSAASGSAAENE